MTVLTYAQFLGGGTGTESDPYRIYTLEHWNEFANEFNNGESAYGDFSGIHLRLMNDITDTIRTRMGGYEGNSNDSEKKFGIIPFSLVNYSVMFWDAISLSFGEW